jgi:hypothetical protein
MLDTATAVTTLRLMNDLRVILLDMGSLFIFSIGCLTNNLRGSQEIDILGRRYSYKSNHAGQKSCMV